MKIEYFMRPDLEDSYGILKLQNLILNIMKYIHDLCEKHHINYYIIGGTALGAVRHGGFIPWDDDLDIAMTRENYDKFIEVCQKEMNEDDFYLQVGRRDWPLYFSKLRLKGTLFDEKAAGEEIAKECRGIFIDIFPFDNASNIKLCRYWQYFCSRLLVAEAVGSRDYKTNSILKKMFILFSSRLKIKRVQDFIYRQITRYNNKETDYIGDFFDSSRLDDASWRKDIWNTPKKYKFEKIELYGPNDIVGYLEEYFGNYKDIPSVEKRKPLHKDEINYGIYN